MADFFLIEKNTVMINQLTKEWLRYNIWFSFLSVF